jgi:hypothetical protein
MALEMALESKWVMVSGTASVTASGNRSETASARRSATLLAMVSGIQSETVSATVLVIQSAST